MESSTESKRSSLENLSKEELLQKCKALLSIAQRAKAAKDGKYRLDDQFNMYSILCSTV